MRAWHVGAHFVEEVGRGGRSALWAVVDAEDQVAELDEGGLGGGAAGVLDVGVGRPAGVEDDAAREAGVGHVLAAGEEGADAVVEDVRVAAVVHAIEEGAELGEARGKGAQAGGDEIDLADAGGGDGAEHEGDDGGAAGFDGDGDEVDPGLVQRAGECSQGREVLEIINRRVGEEWPPVPEADSGVCGDEREL